MGLPAKFTRMFMRISAGVWLAALLATGAPPPASSAEGKKANPAKPPEILMRDAALPAPVARMRDAILEAARG
ncbi:MAG: hypothetical protein AB7O70_16215, partial [Hyphomicrobiales bacterium]